MASAPTASQLRSDMRDWSDLGGFKISSALFDDLAEAQETKWQNNPMETARLVALIERDLPAAKNFQSVPDEAASGWWVRFLDDMTNAAAEMKKGSAGARDGFTWLSLAVTDELKFKKRWSQIAVEAGAQK